MKNLSLKEKLNSVGDAELKSIIIAVCAASGMGKERTEGLVSDIPKLRAALMKTEDGQLEKLMHSLGRQDVENVMKSFRFEA